MVVIGVALVILLAISTASTVYSATKTRAMAVALDRTTAAVDRNTSQAAVAKEHAKSAAASSARADAAAREVGVWVKDIRDAAIVLAKRKTMASINVGDGAPVGGEGPGSAR
jgi:hypothetical protein